MYVANVASTGRDAKDPYQRAVDEPDRYRDADHRKQTEQQSSRSLAFGGKEREHDDGEAAERTDRQVDPAGEQHDQLPEADQRERAGEQQHAVEVAAR